MSLLGNLWDAYFDFHFEACSEIRINVAVQVMIEFLVDNAFKNPDVSAVVEFQDDWNVLEEYCDMIEPAFRSEAQSLRKSLSELVVWRLPPNKPTHAGRPYPFPNLTPRYSNSRAWDHCDSESASHMLVPVHSCPSAFPEFIHCVSCVQIKLLNILISHELLVPLLRGPV